MDWKMSLDDAKSWDQDKLSMLGAKTYKAYKPKVQNNYVKHTKWD